jgi:hypothetical protein
MKRVACGILLLAVVFFFGTVYASTLEEAKTLGEKAAAYVKANGKEKGAAEIGNLKGQSKKSWVQKIEGVEMYTLSGLFQ